MPVCELETMKLERLRGMSYVLVNFVTEMQKVMEFLPMATMALEWPTFVCLT